MTRNTRIYISLIASLLVLVGCGAGKTPPAAKVSDRPATPITAETGALPDKNSTRPVDETQTTRLPDTTGPQKLNITVNDDPRQFLTRDIHHLERMIGTPNLIRRDTDVEVWQYKGAACTLDLFLYKMENRLTVRFVELRGPGSRSNQRACFANMIRQHLMKTG